MFRISEAATLAAILFSPLSLSADLLYGTVEDADAGNVASSTLVELDPETGALIRTIGTVGYVVNGLTYDPVQRKLYASTSKLDDNFTGLIEIDLETGAGTPIGAVNFGQAAGARPVNNLEIGPTGILYGWTNHNDDLVTIDKSTGIATTVGDAGGSVNENGLAFDRSGTLYLVNTSEGNILTMNLSTGAATATGNSLGTHAHHGDIDSNNRYYGIDYTGGQGTPHHVRNLIVADLATGTVLDTLPTVDNLHTLAFLPGPQPDNIIGGRGDNVHNLTGSGQTKPLVSKKARSVRSTLRIQNDAAINDAATLRGSRGNRRFRVTYTGASGNLTGTVTTGSYSTPDLAPGAFDAVGLKIKPVRSVLLRQTNRSKKWLKKKLTLILTSTSKGDPPKQDVAKVKVQHR